MKKIKRIIVYVALLLLVFSFSCVEAQASAGGAFRSLRDFEQEKISELANRFLETDEFSYELVSGITNNNRFVLVTTENQGYLIYDRYIEEYLEYSTTDPSPFEGVKGKKFYLAPSYYFYEDGSELKNAEFGQLVSELARNQLIVADREFKDQLRKAKDLDMETMGSTTIEGGTIAQTTMSTDVEVPYGFYFENLKENMGANTAFLYPGSCGFVAFGMILSYYDTFLNDNIIAEAYDVPTTQHFTNYQSLQLEAYVESPGSDTNLQGHLIQMAQAMGLTTDSSISSAKLEPLAYEYALSRGMTVTVEKTTTLNTMFITRAQYTRNAIDAGFPVVIQISGTDTEVSLDRLNHAVVGYRYNDTGIFANFGWKGSHANTNIHNYSIRNVMYFQFNVSPFASNNYFWTGSGASGSISTAGVIQCNHDTHVYTSLNSTHHLVSCNFCPDSYSEPHNFVYSGNTSTCSDCGYTYTAGCTYIYTTFDETYHIKECSCCGAVLELHTFVLIDNEMVCIHCGFSIYVW